MTDDLEFERLIQRLCEICEALKDDQLTLEKSLELYNEGKEISRKCAVILDRFKINFRPTVQSDDRSKREEKDETNV